MPGPATIRVEMGFGSAPDDPQQQWTDISEYVLVSAGVSMGNGRPDELSAVEPGQLSLTLDNTTGAFTYGNASSPFYPHVQPGVRVRVVLDIPDHDGAAAVIPQIPPPLLPSPGLLPSPTLIPRRAR